MNALVEDYFRYDELAQMEAEAIRHNITGSGTKVLEHSKRFDNNIVIYIFLFLNIWNYNSILTYDGPWLQISVIYLSHDEIKLTYWYYIYNLFCFINIYMYI